MLVEVRGFDSSAWYVNGNGIQMELFLGSHFVRQKCSPKTFIVAVLQYVTTTKASPALIVILLTKIDDVC